MSTSLQDAERYISASKFINIRQKDLRDLTTEDEAEDIDDIQVIKDAIDRSQCEVRDKLKSGGYDVNELFKVNAAKNPRISNWIECLTIYKLYLRANQMEMPMGYNREYEAAMMELTDIANGRAPFSAAVDPEANKPASSIDFNDPKIMDDQKFNFM